MVIIGPADTIGDIATKHPESIPCFDRLHLDFSTEGERTLERVCHEEGVEFERLVDELSGASPESAPEIDWSQKSLQDLTRRLIDHYHVLSRERLSHMQALAMRLTTAKGSKEPQLGRLRRLLDVLHSDLFPHMLKEETILFPWVERLSRIEAGGSIDRPFFGTIRNPVEMMALEHGYVAELLGEIRHMTDDFQAPAGSGEQLTELYALLADFDQLQRLHMHLENNIFFPRAISLESEVRIVGNEDDG